MIQPSPAFSPKPALVRLNALCQLGNAEIAALNAAFADARTVRGKREIVAEASAICEPRIIVSGWAARVRLLRDGRRQFLSFLLPGDLIGMCRQPQPMAVSSVVSITDVALASAPPAAPGSALDRAYAMSMALEEAHLLAHITRLGRLNALERIADLALELLERLTKAGLAVGNSIELPLTQETLGDTLGLTAVHVNRMLQTLRKSGDIDWQKGRLTIANPILLARRVGHVPARVSCMLSDPLFD